MKTKQRLICCFMAVCLFLSIMPVLPVSAEEPGNTKDTAKVIESGADYEAVLNKDEAAWYKYTVEETGYIVLNLKEKDDTTANSLAFWNITAMVDNVKLLDSVYTDNEFTSAKMGLKKGTVVYIQVLGSSNSVDIPYIFSLENTKSSVWESEVNDISKKANTIKANKKYFGNSYYGYPASTSEKDYFKFKATKKGKLNIYFGSNDMANDSCYFSLKVLIKSKEKASVYSKDTFKKIKTINVKKGDVVYFIVTSTDSYMDYNLMVKYK